MKSISLEQIIHSNEKSSTAQRLAVVISLSIPTILAMISEIVMQYIDSAMVGSLGAGASASIGLVASTTWLIGNLVMACAYGFSVQIAQAVGAQDVFISRFKEYRIVPELIECDFYDYLDDKPYAVKAFQGEYMSQYGWAEKTQGKYFY